MTQLPGIQFLDQARTESELKNQFFSDILDSIAELPGGSAVSELTISSGAVTPVAAAHSVDTENDDISDDLERIAVTEHPEGRIIMLSCADNSRAVTVKHAMGGWGQVLLHDESDLVLNDTRDRIILQRKGDNWEEVFRSGPSLQFEAVNPNILKADLPDVIETVYSDDYQTHTGTNLATFTAARNKIEWTLTAASTFDELSPTSPVSLVFYIKPATFDVSFASAYTMYGDDFDATASEVRVCVDINGTDKRVTIANAKAV